jgi:hypothetical protein
MPTQVVADEQDTYEGTMSPGPVMTVQSAPIDPPVGITGPGTVEVVVVDVDGPGVLTRSRAGAVWCVVLSWEAAEDEEQLLIARAKPRSRIAQETSAR